VSLTNLIHVQLKYPTSDYYITIIPIPPLPFHDSLAVAQNGW
jgi:hypothetical protein